MRYHIIGWIDGEKKNPPRFLVAANPVMEKKFSLFRSKPDVNFSIDKSTVCFVLPHTLEWFNVMSPPRKPLIFERVGKYGDKLSE